MVLILVAISGFGVAGYHPEGFKTARSFTGEKMATGMSVFSVGGNTGWAFGPLLDRLSQGKPGIRRHARELPSFRSGFRNARRITLCRPMGPSVLAAIFHAGLRPALSVHTLA